MMEHYKCKNVIATCVEFVFDEVQSIHCNISALEVILGCFSKLKKTTQYPFLFYKTF